MRKLVILSLFFLASCKHDVPLPTPQPTILDALAHLDMEYMDPYKLTDPSDNQQVVFRIGYDKTIYEYKTAYFSKTKANIWVTGTAPDLRLNMTAILGSFVTENDVTTGQGDTIQSYFFVNRANVYDTIQIYKDNNGTRHLTALGHDLTFQEGQ